MRNTPPMYNSTKLEVLPQYKTQYNYECYTYVDFIKSAYNPLYKLHRIRTSHRGTGHSAHHICAEYNAKWNKYEILPTYFHCIHVAIYTFYKCFHHQHQAVYFRQLCKTQTSPARFNFFPLTLTSECTDSSILHPPPG